MNAADEIDFLIVDDDSLFVEMVADSLRGEFGFEGHVAYDGVFAIEMIYQYKYKFIIIDYKMSNVKGDMLVHLLRSKISKNQDTPIFYISGYLPDASEGLTHYKNLQFVDKPIDIDQINALVWRCVG